MSSRNRKSIRNRKSPTEGLHSYEQLEARQMLTVDLGLSFPTAEFDNAAPFATPSVHGAVGPNHIVQVVNGGYSVRAMDGTELFASTTQEFFRDIAGANIGAGTDIFGEEIQGDIQDARIVYDQTSNRFIASAVVAQGNGNPLMGNDILVAISRTDNPIDGFRSVQFTGDTITGQFNNFATLAVDDASVILSTSNSNDTVSIYSLPMADLLGDMPTAANVIRFDNLNPADVGQAIHFASDIDGDSSPNGLSYGIGTFGGGTEISLLRLIDAGGGVGVLDQFNVMVPEYSEAPDGRQPNAVDNLNNISPIITGNAVEEGNFIWAVHTVEGTNNNSAIRWYQINKNSQVVANTGLIEDTAVDYLYPSISVNDFGGVAVGFTATSPTLPPSAFIQLGFSAHGLDGAPTVTFPQEPVFFQQGLANLVNLQDGINPFGEYSATTVDPDNPFSFYSFQEYVAGNDIWGTAVGQASINDISPVINANNANNEVLLRRSSTNSNWLEITIDGNITDVYEIAAIDTLTLNLGDGDDVIQIDYTAGQIATDMGIIINGGDGTDEIDLIDVNGHLFEITGDGSGRLDIVNSFTGFEILTGSSAADNFTAANSASDWVLNGQGGDDVITLANSATGMFVLNGAVGDDTYGVPITNFPNIVINDSIDAEQDTLIGLGTIFDDEIIIENNMITLNGFDVSFFGYDGIEFQSYNGVDGDDTIQVRAIASDTTVFGGSGNDTFNISSNAPDESGVLTTILGKLNIDGGLGINQMTVSNRFGVPAPITVTADQIIGMTTDPINYTGNFGTRDGQQGINIVGSDLAGDVIEIRDILAENSILARGGKGVDTFTVRNSSRGDVVLDGEDGSDTYRTSLGEVNRQVSVNDSGSGFGRDRFSIRATDGADEFTINNNSLGAFGEMFDWSGVENLVVDSRAGDDIITTNRNVTDFIRVLLSDGNDTGIVNGSDGVRAVRFDGLAGNDTFEFNNSVASSFLVAFGGEGNDTLSVGETSFGRSRVDGENGNDIANVSFAARDNRRVNAQDTGTGNDTLNVLGTPQADRVAIRPRVFDRDGEYITYNENTETINYETFGSNDIANVYGTSAAVFNANLGLGNDTVNVISTSTVRDNVQFEFSLAGGLDTGNVFRVASGVQFQIFGQDGDDKFNVGSTTTTNDGNLNNIRGELFIGGGTQSSSGQDTLHVNDQANTMAAFNYIVSDKRFSHSPGPNNVERVFSSFGYSGLEFILASGTDGRNIFNVTASSSTIIRLDGNSQPTTASDTLNVFSGTSSNMFGSPSSGFLTFDSGVKNVSFLEFEDVNAFQTGGSSLTLDPSGDDDMLDSIFSFDADSDLVDVTVDLGLKS